MQFKTFAPLFLTSLTLASPAPQNADSPDSYDTDINELLSLYDSVPSSILSVIETAIPHTWIEALDNPTAISSVIDEMEHGTYPAWYSSLPESVKAWATSAAMAELSGEATATPTAADSDSTSKDTATTGPVETASEFSSMTHSGFHATETPSSGLSSDSSSETSNVAATSATSSPNAAPAATGAVGMGLAGVASLLAITFFL